MELSIIVAFARGGVIGHNGQLPWRLSADLKRFRRLTTGHTIIMGRKTYDSIGRPLPDRRSIVITRNPDFAAPGVTAVKSLDEAIALARDEDEAFVIGGAQIYAEALPRAARLYVTLVDADVPGDVFFPPIDYGVWRLVERSDHSADERNQFAHRFLRYERTLARASGQFPFTNCCIRR
jgi:dihydrofolate reductase